MGLARTSRSGLPSGMGIGASAGAFPSRPVFGPATGVRSIKLYEPENKVRFQLDSRKIEAGADLMVNIFLTGKRCNRE